jgi:hypothetical protein
MLQLKAYAADKHLSMSEAVRGLLREMMNQKLEKQYAAALPEMIDAAVARGLSRTATQTAYFLVTILFELGQVKDFSTNTLGMQEGVTEELLKNILEDADQRTRHSLSRKNPKLTPFIKAVEEWLLAGEDEAGELPAPNGKANGKKEGTASWP